MLALCGGDLGCRGSEAIMVTSMARFLAQLSRRIMGAPQLPSVFSMAASHTVQASRALLSANTVI